MTFAGKADFLDVYNFYSMLVGGAPSFTEDYYRMWLSDANQHIVLARDEQGLPVGMIAWTVWVAALSFPFEVGLVTDMVVNHECRGQGVGSSMLEFVKEWARERKIRVLHLQVNRGDKQVVNFYKSNGFEVRNFGLFYFDGASEESCQGDIDEQQ